MPLEIFYVAILILGLCIGSFINVIVYRIPRVLFFSWFVQCYDFLNLSPKFVKIPKLELNLFLPGSHCVVCKNNIRFIDNIPIISYILLRGKCRFCKHSISIYYPIIELITAVLSLIVGVKVGINIITIFGLLITWTLIVQSAIDFKHCLIPDEITLPMLWLGLIVNYFNMFVNLHEALLGAISGYLVFWVVYWVFKLITNKDGIGYGDFKLLAMLGAWLGYQMLPLIIMISTTLGSIVGGILILLKKCDKNSAIPFGPYLAIAGWVAMLYGNNINYWYLH